MFQAIQINSTWANSLSFCSSYASKIEKHKPVVVFIEPGAEDPNKLHTRNVIDTFFTASMVATPKNTIIEKINQEEPEMLRKGLLRVATEYSGKPNKIFINNSYNHPLDLIHVSRWAEFIIVNTSN